MPDFHEQIDVEEDLPNDFSDGTRTSWPDPPYRRSDDERFRTILAKDWFDEKGLGVKGINRKYKRLPSGYVLFEVPKPDSTTVVYKRLFGHPSKRFYDSTKVFYPHFKWLMSGGQGHCLCKLCSKGPLLERTAFTPRPRQPKSFDPPTRKAPSGTIFVRTRPRTEERVPVDEEGTPDPYRALVQKLQRGSRVNELIEEKQSLDWRAERRILPKFLGRIFLQHSFLPRIGELVLWVPHMTGDLVLNEETGRYELYSFETEEYLGFPKWRAGTVTEVPDKAGDFQDLVKDPSNDKGVNISGYRIETFPDPNDGSNKSLSQHYKYVPLRQIRPLSFWQLLLRGSDEELLHPSTKNALTMFSAVSLVEKWKFRGEKSDAEIFCKGIYLGPELLIVGDAVRILPEKGEACTDILVITSIRLKLQDIVSASSKIASKSSIHLYGYAFTSTAARSYYKNSDDDRPLDADEISRLFPIVGIPALGHLYRLHSPSDRMEVSFDRVLGRLHEPAATCLWLNLSIASTPSATILSYDVPAVRTGRQYSRDTDARIPEDGLWFVADTRVQALALETFNGREVGVYDDAIRNEATLKAWRANLRILDGHATAQDHHDALWGTLNLDSERKKRGRKPGGRVVNGKVLYPGQPGYEEAVSGGARKTPAPTASQMVQASYEDSSVDEDDDEAGEDSIMEDTTAEGSIPLIEIGEKSTTNRRSFYDNNDDEDEAEEEYEIDTEILPPHVERGGTEETEGGDYEPS